MGDADWTKTENKKKKKKIVGKAFNLIATGLYSHSRGRWYRRAKQQFSHRRFSAQRNNNNNKRTERKRK
jgi:hypothetical protein